MMAPLPLLIALLLGPGGPAGADIEAGLEANRAGNAYRAGRFEEALVRYVDLLAEPGESEGELLYNMGNCAYRLERYAEAVLYYRRALVRLPRDGEAVFNLRMAERQLNTDSEAVEPFISALQALAGSFTLGEFLLLIGALQGLGLVGLVLLRRRYAAHSGTTALMVVLVLVGLAGAVRLVHGKWFPGPPYGVVLAEEITLRSEPHSAMPTTYELEAGTVLRVLEMSDRWMYVSHPEGSGWTERAGVGIVD